jgi:hypothetical protein
MGKNKFDQPFRPGQAKTKKEEREMKKEKALAKKLRSKAGGMIPVQAMTQGTEVDYAKKPNGRPGAWEYLGDIRDVSIGVDMAIDTASDEFAKTGVTSFDSIPRWSPREDRNVRVRFIGDARGTDTSRLRYLMGELPTLPKTFEELAEEFVALMQNHERIMEHFN